MGFSELDYTGNRLRLVGTRVIDSEHHVHEAEHQHHHYRHHHLHRPPHHHGQQHAEQHAEQAEKPSAATRDTPMFRKNHAATHFELFYDLWFVANLSVFSSVHDISDHTALISFLGYITLLWTTWGVTTLFDVRYTADSFLERVCRGVHLGVMVVFSEIGTSFNPDDQIQAVFRSMSFSLAASRLVLACQYGFVAFQVRKYLEGWRPLVFTSALHLAAAAVYFGVAFRYGENKNSRVYMVWYIIGVAELFLHLIFSQFSEVLTFLGTNLGERLNLLTLIIIGEGAIILAKNVTLLVKDTYLKDHRLSFWSPTLIGIVTASAALIYIIFQIYFDWLHEEEGGMSSRHQVWWTIMHLPLHAALVLALEGSNQFIIWERIIESVTVAVDSLFQALVDAKEITSVAIVDSLQKTMSKFLEKYQPADVIQVLESVNETLSKLREAPDGVWTGDADEGVIESVTEDLQELGFTMINAIYYAFGITEDKEKHKQADQPVPETNLDVIKEDKPYMASRVNSQIQERFLLVFIYTFACAGIVLLFLTIMHTISKRRGWTPFNIARTAACLAIAVGLSLIPIMANNVDAEGNRTAINNFIGSGWQLPTITIAFFIVLVLTHLPHPHGWCLGQRREGKETEYAEIEQRKPIVGPPGPTGLMHARSSAGANVSDGRAQRRRRSRSRSRVTTVEEQPMISPQPRQSASMSARGDGFDGGSGSSRRRRRTSNPRQASHMSRMSEASAASVYITPDLDRELDDSDDEHGRPRGQDEEQETTTRRRSASPPGYEPYGHNEPQGYHYEDYRQRQ